MKILTDEHCAGLLSKVKVDPFGFILFFEANIFADGLMMSINQAYQLHRFVLEDGCLQQKLVEDYDAKDHRMRAD